MDENLPNVITNTQHQQKTIHHTHIYFTTRHSSDFVSIRIICVLFSCSPIFESNAVQSTLDYFFCVRAQLAKVMNQINNENSSKYIDKHRTQLRTPKMRKISMSFCCCTFFMFFFVRPNFYEHELPNDYLSFITKLNTAYEILHKLNYTKLAHQLNNSEHIIL